MYPGRLRTLRKEAKKTQQQMADMLGITRQGYGSYENNITEPDNETLTRLADFFDVSIDYLMGRTNDKGMNSDRDPVDELVEYIDAELTDEEIIERLNFKVDNITLSDDEVKEFIAFVRVKRAMKKPQQVPSKSE